MTSALRANGWRIERRIGVSDFGVDIGVVDPDGPGRFLAGVKCDGATYRNALTARDRDHLQAIALENLGWHILRAWAPDWWLRKDAALARLHTDLLDLLEAARKSRSQNAHQPPVPVNPAARDDAGTADAVSQKLEADRSADSSDPEVPPESPVKASSLAAPPAFASARAEAPEDADNPAISREPRQAAFSPEPGTEEDRMAKLISQLVGKFWPIHINALARQTAEGLGYKRCSRRIYAETMRIAQALFEFSAEEAAGEEDAVCFWAEGQSRPLKPTHIYAIISISAQI